MMTQSSCFGAAACTVAGQYLLRTDDSLASSAYLISQLPEYARALFARMGEDGDQLSSYRSELQLSAVALALHDVMTLPAVEARKNLRSLIELLKMQYWAQLSTPTARSCFWALYRMGECLLEHTGFSDADTYRYMDGISMPRTYDNFQRIGCTIPCGRH
jgi:hypothetical protein